tara:strand:- start:1067 stop:1804 length:738 start_codon:yes stop_codon:yes gene_type:complete
MEYLNILNVKFINGSYKDIESIILKGGVMVVPAAPALAEYKTNTQYYKALKKSDIAIFDSGFLCLLLLCLKGIKVKKISGLLFLRKFINNLNPLDARKLFTIDPSKNESNLNKTYLLSKNLDIGDNQYVAPIYKDGEITDSKLVEILKQKQPKFIIINLGGGTQETLGVYLKEQLASEYKPTIVCTGAAIAFLTNAQARIPSIIDKLYLGWLARCISQPRKFVPRYLSGFKLFGIIFRSKVEIIK